MCRIYPPYGTISTSADERGVSVRNARKEARKEPLQWFVLRVSYARILKAQTFVESRGLECYVPLRHKQIRKQGHNHIVTEPLFPSFLFVHATRAQVDSLLSDCKNAATSLSRTSSARRAASASASLSAKASVIASPSVSASSSTSASSSASHSTASSIPLLSFYYDHTLHLESDPTKNPPLIIPPSAMDNFIRLTSVTNPHIIPITSPNIHFKLGDLVLITEGEFAGIRGRVARIAGQQRVVVELFDGCLVARRMCRRIL